MGRLIVPGERKPDQKDNAVLWFILCMIILVILLSYLARERRALRAETPTPTPTEAPIGWLEEHPEPGVTAYRVLAEGAVKATREPLPEGSTP